MVHFFGSSLFSENLGGFGRLNLPSGDLRLGFGLWRFFFLGSSLVRKYAPIRIKKTTTTSTMKTLRWDVPPVWVVVVLDGTLEVVDVEVVDVVVGVGFVR